MTTVKQNKLASLLKKKLSELFNNDKFNQDIIIIDINRVDISADLNCAKVYITCFPEQDATFIYNMQMHYNKYYKNKFAQIIRYKIKKLPKIIFYFDYSLYNINYIEKVLKRKF